MLHFVNVFTPHADRRSGHNDQKSFFGPDETPSHAGRDAALRAGELPEAPDEASAAGRETRFASLLSPLFL